MLYKRNAYKKLEGLISYFPAVGLIGPRQVGKTTLAKELAKNLHQSSLYLDLESIRDRSKLADPWLYLRNHPNELVILDEIQLMPELLNELRGIIDEDRKPGRFLILGSASPDLIRKSSESLAGRIAYLELTPFQIGEIKPDDQTTLWIRGGFPDSFTAPEDNLSIEWRKNFVKTYLERDIPRLGLSADPVLIEKFWYMIAGFHGNIWNSENFSRSLGLTGKTVNRYLDFLVNAFLVRSLQPYSVNIKKRLVKSPKIYIRDSGILHYLLGIGSVKELYNHYLVGASWEGHVIEQIQRTAEDHFQYYFYRTHQGTECDLVLVRSGKVTAVEIKFSSAPVLSKSFRLAMEDMDADKGYIIIPTGEKYPLTQNILTIPLAEFLLNELPSLINDA